MKNLRFMMKVLLTMILTLSLTVPAFAEQGVKEDPELTEGLALPIEKFNTLYGKPTSNLKEITSIDKNATLEIQNIQVNDNQVFLSAVVNYNNQNKTLEATGELYNSYKQEDSINSIVGDLKDKSGNFEIKLFDIYNDTAKDKMIVNNSLENMPHLKTYLNDHQGNIILFETPLPEDLENISVKIVRKLILKRTFFGSMM